MKQFRLLLLTLSFLSVEVHCQTQNTTQGSQQDLIRLSRDLIRSVMNADLKKVRSLLADDFKMVTPQGLIIGKEQFIKELPTTPVTEFAIRDTLMEQRIYGETGVVTSMMVYDFSGITSYMASTDVFARQKGQWKLVSTHETKVPAWRMRQLQDSEMEVLSVLSCEEQEKVKSLHADVPTFLRIRNSTSGAITPYWIDYTGQRDTRADQIKTIGAGQSWNVETYVTHPFLILDSSGKCLGIVQPTAKPGMIVIKDK